VGTECEQFEGRARGICEGTVYDERQTRIWRARRGLDEPGEPKERKVSTPAVKTTKPPLQLGDAVERALTAVGITSERVTKFLGQECGCAERKKKLNDLGAWAARVLLGERSEPPLG